MTDHLSAAIETGFSGNDILKRGGPSKFSLPSRPS